MKLIPTFPFISKLILKKVVSICKNSQYYISEKGILMNCTDTKVENYATGYVNHIIKAFNPDAPWRTNLEPLTLKIKWSLTGLEGPILILINGFQEVNNPEGKLVKGLSKNYRVLMVDIPGFIDGKPPILSFCEGAEIIKKTHKRITSLFKLENLKTNLCCFSLGGCIAIAIKDDIKIDTLLMIGTPSGSSEELLLLLEKPGSTSIFASKTTPDLNPKLLDMLSKWDFDLPPKQQKERSLWAEILNRDHIIGAIPKSEFLNIDIDFLLDRDILTAFGRDGNYYQINYVKLIELNLVNNERNIVLPIEYKSSKVVLEIFDRYMTIKPVAKRFIYCHGVKDPLVCKSSIRARIPKNAEIITHNGGHFVTLQRKVKIENIIQETFNKMSDCII